MQVTNEKLGERLERRLDRIEEKLDKFLEREAIQEAQLSSQASDINWVKGYIKFSVSAIITIVGGVVTLIFNMFK